MSFLKIVMKIPIGGMNEIIKNGLNLNQRKKNL